MTLYEAAQSGFPFKRRPHTSWLIVKHGTIYYQSLAWLFPRLPTLSPSDINASDYHTNQPTYSMSLNQFVQLCYRANLYDTNTIYKLASSLNLD